MKTGLRASWFPRVGWEGLGNAKMKHEKCFGASWLPRVGWEGGLGVSHGSQEWGGKGLGKLTMKHEKGFWRFSWFPRVGWEKLGKAKNEA